MEQYNLLGFAGMYAKKLHVPRASHARQAMLWLLQCAPGVPTDGALVVGDIGAGTCAACLGARLALRDHAGEEQPIKVYPIDVASSSARFQRAFAAMTRQEKFGPAPPLPAQHASQYLSEAQPGVDSIALSLLAQLRARGERQPHVVLASFSLHYLSGDEREALFRRLAAAASRPFLLVIIKGVGTRQRPPSGVPSVHYGLHYYVGPDEKLPRVIEAHCCLIEPSGRGDELERGGGAGGSGAGGEAAPAPAAEEAEEVSAHALWPTSRNGGAAVSSPPPSSAASASGSCASDPSVDKPEAGADEHDEASRLPENAEGASVPAPPPAAPEGRPDAAGGSSGGDASARATSAALTASAAHEGAQACGAPPQPLAYDPDDPDSWVICTFATLQRRCRLQGLRVGTTVYEGAGAARD